MNLLLDTQLLLWSTFQGSKLSAEARRLIDDRSNRLFLSVVSVWEIAMKRAQGKPSFQVDPKLFRAALLGSGYRELQITGEHAIAAGSLPMIHRDPLTDC